MSAANNDVEEIAHLEIFTCMISVVYLEVEKAVAYHT